MWPRQYRLVVNGELGPRYGTAFEGMTISAHDGITEITGAVNDRSHLRGLLTRIDGLGLTLDNLNPVGTESAAAPGLNVTRPSWTVPDVPRVSGPE
jgi:hypothetical protein